MPGKPDRTTGDEKEPDAASTPPILMLISKCAWRHAYRQALFCILLGVCQVRQRRKTRMQNRAFLLGAA